MGLTAVDMEGNRLEGGLQPSSKPWMHLAICKARPDVHAILHIHSVHVGLCAVAGLKIPPIIDELVIQVGAGVPLAEYVFPGTWEWAEAVIAGLGEPRTVLLRSQGLLALGRDAREAVEIAPPVERLAQVFVCAHLLCNEMDLAPDVVQ